MVLGTSFTHTIGFDVPAWIADNYDEINGINFDEKNDNIQGELYDCQGQWLMNMPTSRGSMRPKSRWKRITRSRYMHQALR